MVIDVVQWHLNVDKLKRGNRNKRGYLRKIETSVFQQDQHSKNGS
jgi:hypothetical protein